jgi:ABC-type phosphate transport system substrate-binding protein
MKKGTILLLLLLLMVASSSMTMGKDTRKIAVIVSVDWVAADSVETDELKLIYLGKIKDFAGKKVNPRQRRRGLPIRGRFVKSVLGMNERVLKKYWIEEQFKRGARPPAASFSFKSVINYVSNVEGAISYIDASRLKGDVLEEVKILPLRVGERVIYPSDAGYFLQY